MDGCEYRSEPLQGEASTIVARELAVSAEQALTASAIEITERFRVRGTPRPRLVAFDIDGTLLDHRNRLSARVVGLLRELDRTDTQVVIATGRSVVELLPVLAALALPNLWVVCSNGAVTLHTRTAAGTGLGGGAVPAGGGGTAAIEYRIVHTVEFAPAGPARALQAAFPAAIFATEILGRGFAVTQRFPDGEIIGDQVVGSFTQVMAAPTTKLVARVVGMERDEFEAQIDAIGLQDVQWCVGWGAWMDAAPPGTSKATGLRTLAADLGISSAEAVAVGDSTNDIEMFQWAGHAIGIGSGNPRALAAADVVVPGVLEDGAAAPLRALMADVVPTEDDRSTGADTGGAVQS